MAECSSCLTSALPPCKSTAYTEQNIDTKENYFYHNKNRTPPSNPVHCQQIRKVVRTDHSGTCLFKMYHLLFAISHLLKAATDMLTVNKQFRTVSAIYLLSICCVSHTSWSTPTSPAAGHVYFISGWRDSEVSPLVDISHTKPCQKTVSRLMSLYANRSTTSQLAAHHRADRIYLPTTIARPWATDGVLHYAVMCKDYTALLLHKRNTSKGHWWNDTVRADPNYSGRKTCPSATLPTNPTRTGTGDQDRKS